MHGGEAVKRKLLNVVLYGAMILTACAVNRGVPEKATTETAEETTTAASAAAQEIWKKEIKSIGRTAEIGEFGDYDHKTFSDLGVSVEVSNQMMENRALAEYPFWLGNREQIEDGIRYIYETAYLIHKEEIQYTKYIYDTEEIVEQYIFDAITGESKTN